MNPFNPTIIRVQARLEKIGVGDMEKDYVLSVVLTEISKWREAKRLVFKGGTSLKKIHFPKYRFSSDLDFTAIANVKTELKKRLESDFENTSVEGIKFVKLQDITEKDKNTLRIQMQYESGIGVFQGKPHVDSIILDFNFDAKVYAKIIQGKVNLPGEYGLAPEPILTMNLEEILAEKVDAIYSRRKPRDVYDLWYLLKNGTRFDIQLVGKKLEEKGRKFELQTLMVRLEKLKPFWQKDMMGLLEKIPDYEEITKELLQEIEKL